MRLIGMGLLAFLFIAVATLLSRSAFGQLDWYNFGTTWRAAALRFETSLALEKQELGRDQVFGARIDINDPIVLSGLPSYGSATFLLPRDARPQAGHLQIDTTLQVLDGVQAVLRVSIAQTKRAEILLRPGDTHRSVLIELLPTEIAAEWLVVSFTLQGEGPNSPCPTDTGIQVSAEIEATSGLYLGVNPKDLSVQDRVNISGNLIDLHWPDAPNLQAETIQKAATLTNVGYDIHLSSSGAALVLEQTQSLTQYP